MSSPSPRLSVPDSKPRESPGFRRLLVGICGDRRSDHALRAAIALAERWGADLEVLHAVPLRHPEWLDIGRVRLAASTAGTLTRAWRGLIDHLAKELPGLKWHDRPLEKVLRVLPGHPAKLLLDQCRQSSADLLLLGAHARRGLLDFGNTARAILAKADCPLWIQVTEPAPIRRILVPVELSDESLYALDLARRLGRSFGASVLALTCFDPPASLTEAGDAGDADLILDQVQSAARRKLDQLLGQIAWGEVEHGVIFAAADPAREILGRQDEHDLIVMGTQGRTRLSAAVLGSTTYAVLREARVPVLVLRRPPPDRLA